MKTISTHRIAGEVGIGLRTEHIHPILDAVAPTDSTIPTDSINPETIPWLELLVDNWLADGGLTKRYLEAIAERYPLTLHGVGLSLGGMEPLNINYLNEIKRIMERSGALWYSEHLCFSQLASYYSHDLLPLPYTEEAINHLVRRIAQVQDYFGCQLIIENVSSYLEYKHSTLSEGEFINAIATESGCGLLLDVNNFYVNQVNHGQDSMEQILRLSPEYIKEIHLAGFADKGDYVIDAHNNPVSKEVWDLYEATLQHVGNVPTLVEWDNDIPALDVLLSEREKAQRYLDSCSQSIQLAQFSESSEEKQVQKQCA
ncbi:MAG: DUF692 domain-containing protein [Thiotrichaceae bacterium]